MRNGQASQSAMMSALLKAAHVLEDPPPWIFDDSLGGRLLTADETKRVRSAISRLPSEVYRACELSSPRDPAWPKTLPPTGSLRADATMSCSAPASTRSRGGSPGPPNSQCGK
jgi:hypothetical protein